MNLINLLLFAGSLLFFGCAIFARDGSFRRSVIGKPPIRPQWLGRLIFGLAGAILLLFAFK